MPLFFFRNPVLGPLEDLLWRKAKARYVTEGGSPIKDLKQIDKATRRKLEGWVDQWRAEENAKLKPVWKEFKQIIKGRVAEGISAAFRRSNQASYSVEKGDIPSFPDVIAVPLPLLRRQTDMILPDLLGDKIQFKDMLPETRQALARYAIDRSFNDEFQKARGEYRHFQVGARYDPFIIADIIERDFYHLGASESASRIDMVILTTFFPGNERAAIDSWNQFLPNRSDHLRFTGEGWNVSQADLLAMVKR